MDKKTAEKHGLHINPIKSNMHRRSVCHNYRAPGYYMVTLVATDRRCLFGELVEGANPYIRLYPLGQAIQEHEIQQISVYYPMVSVVKLTVMPDHLHMIIHVDDWLDKKKHLGKVIGGFKIGCNRAYMRITGHAFAGDGKTGIFQRGYNDRILVDANQIDRWKRYLDDNPRRLALKRQNHDFFTVIHHVNIADKECDLFGNQFLLDIPDKMAVIVHRSDTEAEYERKYNEWMACGERGGVLVSAAIAEGEKMVMRAAMDRGYCLIVLSNKGYGPMYKPAGEAFDACCEGRLLLLSPWSHTNQKLHITRADCLLLNNMATRITGESPACCPPAAPPP